MSSNETYQDASKRLTASLVELQEFACTLSEALIEYEVAEVVHKFANNIQGLVESGVQLRVLMQDDKRYTISTQSSVPVKVGIHAVFTKWRKIKQLEISRVVVKA